MKSRFDDDDLILFFYGEAKNAEAVRAALAGSPELAARYAELSRVLGAVDALAVPERGPFYGAAVWARLEPKLASQPSPGGWGRLGLRRWSWAGAAAAVLLVAGFFAGRYLAPDPSLSVAARERILLAAVAGHLDRSERLMTELANAATGEGLDLSAEREWAQSLLAANRLYRQSARQGGKPRLAELLGEIEPFLIELAHAPDETSPEELHELTRRIEEQALLFKLRIVSDRLARAKPTVSL
jgi:hypothetical protein